MEETIRYLPQKDVQRLVPRSSGKGTHQVSYRSSLCDTAKAPVVAKQQKDRITIDQHSDTSNTMDAKGCCEQEIAQSNTVKYVYKRVILFRDRDVVLNSKFPMSVGATNLDELLQVAINRAIGLYFRIGVGAMWSTCVSRSLKILSPTVESRGVESLTTSVESEHRTRRLEEKFILTVNEVDDLGTNLLSGT